MLTQQNSFQDRPISDAERRSLDLQAERNAGFRSGAFSVLAVALMVGAFWVGLQAGPLL